VVWDRKYTTRQRPKRSSHSAVVEWLSFSPCARCMAISPGFTAGTDTTTQRFYVPAKRTSHDHLVHCLRMRRCFRQQPMRPIWLPANTKEGITYLQQMHLTTSEFRSYSCTHIRIHLYMSRHTTATPCLQFQIGTQLHLSSDGPFAQRPTPVYIGRTVVCGGSAAAV
jgi:hypothetical protein